VLIHHGYKTIPVSKIKAPGDIEKIRREAHTLELGESLEATGGKPIDPIIVEWGTWALRGGKHRFAAALNSGLKEVDAILLEGTPEEIETACLVEQTKRRTATDAETARLVELLHPTPEQTFPDVEASIEEDPPLAPRKPGRPSSGKSEAVAKVAAITGRTEAAVKQADYRSRHADADEPKEPEPASCIETMGIKVPSDVHADAWSEAQFLESVERTLVKQQADCKRHESVGSNPYPQLYAALHEAAALARSLMPKSVCPHCKLTSLKRGCLACRGRGWLRAHEMANVPQDLLRTGEDAGVYVNGKWTHLKEVK
jgi:hypothetical protein